MMYQYLIIDDEPLIRKGTIKKLAPLSHLISCCAEAENAEDGIALIQKLHPDVVILDMQMPGMGGLGLLPYLSEHYPDITLIVISGYQNFDYIKQAISSKAIDYILKPFSKEQIQETVLGVIKNLDNREQISSRLNAAQEEKEFAYYNLDLQFLENLILGHDTENHAFYSQKLSFLNQAHSFVLFTLYLRKIPKSTGLQKWIENSSCLAPVLYLPHPSIPQFRYILVFTPTDSRQSQPIIRSFSNALVLWAQQQKIPFYTGISQPQNSILQLHAAFLETTDALNMRRLLNDVPFCTISQHTQDPIPFHWEQEDEFLFRIETGKEEIVQNMTDQLFNSYLTIPDFTLADAKRHCEQLSIQCRIMINYYLQKQEDSSKPSQNMHVIVNTLFSFSDLKQYYLQFFLNITKLIGSQSIYAGNELIDQIKLYIQRNYSKNLTQEYLASLFYLNRSYLSQLFRKKTGQKFIDYINEIRIDKSKEFLAASDRKMHQIAKAVGYDNPKYFFRIFKKKTGVTPEQYREKYQKR